MIALVAVLAAAAPVVICADEQVSPVLKAKLEAEGRKVIDASLIDRALFSGELKRGNFATPLPKLPPDVLADVKKGIAGCARVKTGECGAHLVQAAWQRYLNRMRPEVVIEVRPEGAAAVYRHDDALLTVVAGELDDVVKAALGRPAGRIAARPMGAVLPGERPIAEPDLALGRAQQLPALKLAVPEGCVLPQLEVGPAKAPLAMTTQALWKASFTKPATGALACTFDLIGESLQLQCGERFEAIELFPSTVFDDPAYQASLARHFVAWVLGGCAKSL